jgi:hypothetical protein
MKLEVLLTFSCPYIAIPLLSGVHVNLIHIGPQSLTKTELASMPHYHVVQFPYEIIRVSEAHKPAIKKVPS